MHHRALSGMGTPSSRNRDGASRRTLDSGLLLGRDFTHAEYENGGNVAIALHDQIQLQDPQAQVQWVGTLEEQIQTPRKLLRALGRRDAISPAPTVRSATIARRVLDIEPTVALRCD